ncbi:hypothetical protein BDR26DRAFT_892938 [Obelidium mucronatum]|nr:hypothetical protein BDR26DRAFT_892938 [Obelidium mucronatum]
MSKSVRLALAVFGLDRDASATDIRKQYHKLSRQAHPDKGGTHEQMTVLNEAYEILSASCSSSPADSFRPKGFSFERTKPKPKPPPPPPPPPPPLPVKALRLQVDIVDGPLASIQKKYKTQLRFRWTPSSSPNAVMSSVHVRPKGSTLFNMIWTGSGKSSGTSVVLENMWGDLEFCVKVHSDILISNDNPVVSYHILSPPVRPFAVRLESLRADTTLSANAYIDALASQRGILQTASLKSVGDSVSKQVMTETLETEIFNKLRAWKLKLKKLSTSLLCSLASVREVSWPMINCPDWRSMRATQTKWKSFVGTLGIDEASGVIGQLSGDAIKEELDALIRKTAAAVRIGTGFRVESNVITKSAEDGLLLTEYIGVAPINAFDAFLAVWNLLSTIQHQMINFGDDSGDWSGRLEVWKDACNGIIVCLRKDMDARVADAFKTNADCVINRDIPLSTKPFIRKSSLTSAHPTAPSPIKVKIAPPAQKKFPKSQKQKVSCGSIHTPQKPEPSANVTSTERPFSCDSIPRTPSRISREELGSIESSPLVFGTDSNPFTFGFVPPAQTQTSNEQPKSVETTSFVFGASALDPKPFTFGLVPPTPSSTSSDKSHPVKSPLIGMTIAPIISSTSNSHAPAFVFCSTAPTHSLLSHANSSISSAASSDILLSDNSTYSHAKHGSAFVFGSSMNSTFVFQKVDISASSQLSMPPRSAKSPKIPTTPRESAAGVGRKGIFCSRSEPEICLKPLTANLPANLPSDADSTQKPNSMPNSSFVFGNTANSKDALFVFGQDNSTLPTTETGPIKTNGKNMLKTRKKETLKYKYNTKVTQESQRLFSAPEISLVENVTKEDSVFGKNSSKAAMAEAVSAVFKERPFCDGPEIKQKLSKGVGYKSELNRTRSTHGSVGSSLDIDHATGEKQTGATGKDEFEHQTGSESKLEVNDAFISMFAKLSVIEIGDSATSAPSKQSSEIEHPSPTFVFGTTFKTNSSGLVNSPVFVFGQNANKNMSMDSNYRNSGATLHRFLKKGVIDPKRKR